MQRHIRFIPLLAALCTLTAFAAPSRAKWPPWLSFEAPVNPYDGSLAGAVMLIHAATRDGIPAISDISGSAEGLVSGSLRFHDRAPLIIRVFHSQRNDPSSLPARRFHSARALDGGRGNRQRLRAATAGSRLSQPEADARLGSQRCLGADVQGEGATAVPLTASGRVIR